MLNKHSAAQLSRSPVWIFLLILIALLLIGLGCSSDQTEVQEETLIAGGRASFQAYCASCHGRDGKGGGPVAEIIEIPIPDLTRLEQRYGGSFPTEYVMRTIDGRDETVAHGSRTMPVWGNIWRYDTDEERAESEAQRLYTELTHFLESIQVETEGAE